ncbi:MAG: response regulator [Planctomycetes bacterium]|nr:response regulator [Planctomycetota bacterium]
MKNILIVDDDDIMSEMLAQMMELENHNTTIALNGNDAIKLLRESNYDLMITDIVMPEKDGLETIIAVRQSHPDLPIIAISGGGRIEPESYLFMAEQLGAKHIFTKPLDRITFSKAVNQCLEEAELN